MAALESRELIEVGLVSDVGGLLFDADEIGLWLGLICNVGDFFNYYGWLWLN